MSLPENGLSEGDTVTGDDQLPGSSADDRVMIHAEVTQPLPPSIQIRANNVSTETMGVDSVLNTLGACDSAISSMAALSVLSSPDPLALVAAGEDAVEAELCFPISKTLSVCGQKQCEISRLDYSFSDSCSSTDSSDGNATMNFSGHVLSRKKDGGNKHKEILDTFVPRTKGEILYKDLPPVERCNEEFPANGRLLPIATVSHYTERLRYSEIVNAVVVACLITDLPNTPTLDEGTVLWTKGQVSIAQVFETFGPVIKPFYSIRIKSVDDLLSLGVALGDTVYVIPAHPAFTKYVFSQELMKWKGSDASWKDDNEVPTQFVDYSDDEGEKKATKKKTGIGKGKISGDCKRDHVGSIKCSKETTVPKATRPAVYSYHSHSSIPPGATTTIHSHYSGTRPALPDVQTLNYHYPATQPENYHYPATPTVNHLYSAAMPVSYYCPARPPPIRLYSHQTFKSTTQDTLPSHPSH